MYLGILEDVVISEDEVGILIVSFPSMWKKSLENNQTQLKTESDILNLITHSSDVTLCMCVCKSFRLSGCVTRPSDPTKTRTEKQIRI